MGPVPESWETSHQVWPWAMSSFHTSLLLYSQNVWAIISPTSLRRLRALSKFPQLFTCTAKLGFEPRPSDGHSGVFPLGSGWRHTADSHWTFLCAEQGSSETGSRACLPESVLSGERTHTLSLTRHFISQTSKNVQLPEGGLLAWLTKVNCLLQYQKDQTPPSSKPFPWPLGSEIILFYSNLLIKTPAVVSPDHQIFFPLGNQEYLGFETGLCGPQKSWAIHSSHLGQDYETERGERENLATGQRKGYF